MIVFFGELVEKQENLGHMIQIANYYVFIEKKSNECKYSLLFLKNLSALNSISIPKFPPQRLISTGS